MLLHSIRADHSMSRSAVSHQAVSHPASDDELEALLDQVQGTDCSCASEELLDMLPSIDQYGDLQATKESTGSTAVVKNMGMGGGISCVTPPMDGTLALFKNGWSQHRHAASSGVVSSDDEYNLATTPDPSTRAWATPEHDDTSEDLLAVPLQADQTSIGLSATNAMDSTAVLICTSPSASCPGRNTPNELACAESVDVEAANLAFLDDANMLLLPLPTGESSTTEIREPEDCPHCSGERLGYGRYQAREKSRSSNPLRPWNQKHGYTGPAYCKACSESFRSHLLRSGRNPRNGCSRIQPCADCSKILSHFAGLTPTQVFARYDASLATPGGRCPARVDSVAQPDEFPRLKKRKQSAATLAVALCVACMVSSGRQESASYPTDSSAHGGAQRQLRNLYHDHGYLQASSANETNTALEAALTGSGDAEHLIPQMCCPTCCNELPAVPSWVPLRWFFPYMATDYSAVIKPAMLSTRRAQRFLDALSPFEVIDHQGYVGRHWDGQHEHGNAWRQLELQPQGFFLVSGRVLLGHATLNDLLNIPGLQDCRRVMRALGFFGSDVRRQSSSSTVLLSESNEAKFAASVQGDPGTTAAETMQQRSISGTGGGEMVWIKSRRFLPSAPHIRTGLVVATIITTIVIATGWTGQWGRWRKNWKCAAACTSFIHLVCRPVLGIGFAALADVLDPSLAFGLRHEL